MSHSHSCVDKPTLWSLDYLVRSMSQWKCATFIYSWIGVVVAVYWHSSMQQIYCSCACLCVYLIAAKCCWKCMTYPLMLSENTTSSYYQIHRWNESFSINIYYFCFKASLLKIYTCINMCNTKEILTLHGNQRVNHSIYHILKILISITYWCGA